MATWLWEAKDATVYVGNTITTVATTSTLYSQSTASTGAKNMTAIVKSVKFKPGAHDVDKVDTFGTVSGSLGYYPNQFISQGRPDLAEVELTLLPQTSDSSVWFGSTGGVVVTGGAMRCIGADVTSLGARAKMNVMSHVTNSSGYYTFLANNAIVTSIDNSLDVDGHIEQTVTFKALNADCFDQSSGSWS